MNVEANSLRGHYFDDCSFLREDEATKASVPSGGGAACESETCQQPLSLQYKQREIVAMVVS